MSAKRNNTKGAASRLFNGRADSGTDVLKWEWRIFWPEKSLHPIKFGDFSVIEGKRPDEIVLEKNPDTYVLIPGSKANIKLQGNSVSCKVLAAKTKGLRGFQKKQTYEFPITPAVFTSLTGLSARALVTSPLEFISIVLMQRPHTKIITAIKERKTAKFKKPQKDEIEFDKMNAEFSSVEIDGRKFWTFCLISNSKKRLEAVIEKMDVGSGRVMDYTEFLSHFSARTVIRHRAAKQKPPQS